MSDRPNDFEKLVNISLLLIPVKINYILSAKLFGKIILSRQQGWRVSIVSNN